MPLTVEMAAWWVLSSPDNPPDPSERILVVVVLRGYRGVDPRNPCWRAQPLYPSNPD